MKTIPNFTEIGYILDQILNLSERMYTNDVLFMDVYIECDYDTDNDFSIGDVVRDLRKNKIIRTKHLKRLNEGWWRKVN